MREQIETKVKQVVADKLGLEPSQVSLETHFTMHLKADPLDTGEIIEELQSYYDLSISEEEMQMLETVGQLITYIEQHAKHKKS